MWYRFPDLAGMNVHAAGGGNRTGDEQQRVPWQERRHYQPGLAEHDQEQDQVDPGAVTGDQRLQVVVKVDNQVNKQREQLHGSLL